MAAESARIAAIREQTAGEPQYLRLKAEATQLATAQDDGRITFLEFASPVPAEMTFFDQDGRRLPSASAGRVAAVEGVHQGILVRRADQASFVSPNPRALSLPRRPLPDMTDYGEARAKLENQGSQLQAMRRAMEAAQVVAPPPSVAPSQTAAPLAHNQTAFVFRSIGSLSQQPSASPSPPSPPTSPPPSPPSSPPSLPLPLLPSAQAPSVPSPSSSTWPMPMPLPTPLAAANAFAAAPERGLVRVFFATASRAIVAPDDGLALLLREAANADEVQVTGFTDATGSRATNEGLARARADAVVQILLRRGIPGNRIYSGAVGAAEFIADNASEKGRALNRRAEVILMKNGAPMNFAASLRATR